MQRHTYVGAPNNATVQLFHSRVLMVMIGSMTMSDSTMVSAKIQHTLQVCLLRLSRVLGRENDQWSYDKYDICNDCSCKGRLRGYTDYGHTHKADWPAVPPQ